MSSTIRCNDDFDTGRSGSIVQVQHTMYTGTQTVALTAGVAADVSGLTATITPVHADSFIKVDVIFHNEFSSTINYDIVGFFSRNGVDVRGAPTAGSRPNGMGINSQGFWDSPVASTMDTMSFTYFDTPASTSLQTYILRISSGVTGTMYVNRTVTDSDASGFERLISTIVLTEIRA